ncbi:MAG: alpha-E domain-containing protein, partial [Pseudomonadota bacterium]
MLGKTAGGLFWMFRGLERAENTARLIEAGFRIALTRSSDPEGEWQSVIVTAAQQAGYDAKYDHYASTPVVDYLLRDMDNPSSVRATIKTARDNARLTRTALTTEVWAAVNEAWLVLNDRLAHPVPETELPDVLDIIRRQSALVRGALYGTMLRNDIFDFCRLGTFVERADSTARIIDVKYHTLLPSPSFVGSRMDNVQWEMVLRSVSAHRSFRWAEDGDYNAINIANFLILDRRMPRS